MVDGDGAGFGHGKGHQWTLFAWMYAQFGLGRAGRSACGEWRSTVQWWMRKVQGMRGRLKCIGHCPRGDSGSVDIVSFGADERWGECQRATQRRRRGEAGGVPGDPIKCAGVGACSYCAWRWVLYMVWAWLDLHGTTNTCGLSWGNTCVISWGNFVNKIRFSSIFCIFCIFDTLCILYRLSVDWGAMHNV